MNALIQTTVWDYLGPVKLVAYKEMKGEKWIFLSCKHNERELQIEHLKQGSEKRELVFEQAEDGLNARGDRKRQILRVWLTQVEIQQYLTLRKARREARAPLVRVSEAFARKRD